MCIFILFYFLEKINDDDHNNDDDDNNNNDVIKGMISFNVLEVIKKIITKMCTGRVDRPLNVGIIPKTLLLFRLNTIFKYLFNKNQVPVCFLKKKKSMPLILFWQISYSGFQKNYINVIKKP